MSASSLPSSDTLIQALRMLAPTAAQGLRVPSPQALAALADGAAVLDPVIQVVGALAAACARGDVAAAHEALSRMSLSLLTAEATFLLTCRRHGVSPDSVVASIADLRALLQVASARAVSAPAV